MINLFHINDYEIRTTMFSNLLHDKIVREFEENFARYVGAKYACSANSASSLIQIALRRGANIAHIPSILPFVVPNALINARVPYKFVDDIEWVGGSYVICEYCSRKIIDSAQKVERDQFKNEANPEDWMVFSFYPTKPVGGCDGGMIVSDDKESIDWFKTAVFNGTKPSENSWEREVVFPGHKAHINSIQAYIANENLKKNWTPLWIKKTDEPNTGNTLIKDAGGAWCESNSEKIDPSLFFNFQEKKANDHNEDNKGQQKLF